MQNYFRFCCIVALAALCVCARAETNSDEQILTEARRALSEKDLSVPDVNNAAVLRQHDYIFVEFYEADRVTIVVRCYFDRQGRRYPLVDHAKNATKIPRIVGSIDLAPYKDADALWRLVKDLDNGNANGEKWPQLFYAVSEFLERYPKDPRRWEARETWLWNGPFVANDVAWKFFKDVRNAPDAPDEVKKRVRAVEKQWELEPPKTRL
jgi:hypothetical protein